VGDKWKRLVGGHKTLVEIGSLSLEAIAGEGVKQGKKDKIVVFICGMGVRKAGVSGAN